MHEISNAAVYSRRFVTSVTSSLAPASRGCSKFAWRETGSRRAFCAFPSALRAVRPSTKRNKQNNSGIHCCFDGHSAGERSSASERPAVRPPELRTTSGIEDLSLTATRLSSPNTRTTRRDRISWRSPAPKICSTSATRGGTNLLRITSPSRHPASHFPPSTVIYRRVSSLRSTRNGSSPLLPFSFSLSPITLVFRSGLHPVGIGRFFVHLGLRPRLSSASAPLGSQRLVVRYRSNSLHPVAKFQRIRGEVPTSSHAASSLLISARASSYSRFSSTPSFPSLVPTCYYLAPFFYSSFLPPFLLSGRFISFTLF